MTIKNKVRLQKIETYLAEQLKGSKMLKILIDNLGLRGLYVEKFEETFGKMSPEEMAKFIMEGDKAYELGRWSSGQKNITRGRYLDSVGKRHTGDGNSDRGES